MLDFLLPQSTSVVFQEMQIQMIDGIPVESLTGYVCTIENSNPCNGFCRCILPKCSLMSAAVSMLRTSVVWKSRGDPGRFIFGSAIANLCVCSWGGIKGEWPRRRPHPSPGPLLSISKHCNERYELL